MEFKETIASFTNSPGVPSPAEDGYVLRAAVEMSWETQNLLSPLGTHHVERSGPNRAHPGSRVTQAAHSLGVEPH